MNESEVVDSHDRHKKANNHADGHIGHDIDGAFNYFQCFGLDFALTAIVIVETLADGLVDHVKALALQRTRDSCAQVNLGLASGAVEQAGIAGAIECVGLVEHDDFGAYAAVLAGKV